MNPFLFIRTQFYPNHDGFGETAGACLILRILEANYSGGMAAGANAFRYALTVLEEIAPDNTFVKKLRADWHSKANPHI